MKKSTFTLIISIFLSLNTSSVFAEEKRETISQLLTYCEMGSSGSCHNLALAHATGDGIKQDYKRAKTYYLMGCKYGNMNSCNNIGVQFFFGLGVKEDSKKALEYWKMACNKSNNIACENQEIFNNSSDKSKNAIGDKIKSEGIICNENAFWKCVKKDN